MSASPRPIQPAAPEAPAAAAPPFNFICSRRAETGGSIHIVLAGELDRTATTHLTAALDAAQDDSDKVVLDLRALTLIDGAGLAVLFAAGRRSRAERTSLIFLSARGQVRRVLDLLGVPDGIDLFEEDDLIHRAFGAAG